MDPVSSVYDLDLFQELDHVQNYTSRAPLAVETGKLSSFNDFVRRVSMSRSVVQFSENRGQNSSTITSRGDARKSLSVCLGTTQSIIQNLSRRRRSMSPVREEC
jgi:hypothetical protein